MNYYQEITLLPKARICLFDFWEKFFQQIHLALVENKSGESLSDIGVSFPEYTAAEYLLGTKLRLFSDNEHFLTQLNCEKWLNRLSVYVRLDQIKPVPEKIEGQACFKHIKLKGSKEKLARRRAKRKGETLEQALKHYADYKEPCSKLPFINMTSQTNGQRFRLFIEKQVMEEPRSGLFSCYGLSNKITVPLF